MLDEAVARKLTLICAPGGFGRTALFSQWWEERGRKLPLGWVALSEAENDPATFWSYVAAALDRVEPGAGSSLKSTLHSAPAGPSETIWMACANAVSDPPLHPRGYRPAG